MIAVEKQGKLLALLSQLPTVYTKAFLSVWRWFWDLGKLHMQKFRQFILCTSHVMTVFVIHVDEGFSVWYIGYICVMYDHPSIWGRCNTILLEIIWVISQVTFFIKTRSQYCEVVKSIFQQPLSIDILICWLTRN